MARHITIVLCCMFASGVTNAIHLRCSPSSPAQECPGQLRFRELMKEEKEDGNAVARENYSSRSAAAVLMMVFQFAKDNTAIHRQGRTDGDREMS